MRTRDLDNHTTIKAINTIKAWGIQKPPLKFIIKTMASTSTGRTGKKYSTEEVLAELFADSDSGGEDFGNSDSDVDIFVPDVEENESSGGETVVQTKNKTHKEDKSDDGRRT